MITNKDYLSSIRKCYLFDGIEDKKLTEAIMLLNGRIRKIQKDEFIVRLGDELQSAGLLLKGRIESSFQNESFDQITMHRFGGGYLFGEALVINDTKNSPVQVRAVEECTILFIDLKAIYLSEETSPLRLKLAENLINFLSVKFAVVIIMARGSPSVSTPICSFIPEVFFPHHNPCFGLYPHFGRFLNLR